MTSLAGGALPTLPAQQMAAGWEQRLRPIQSVRHQAGYHRVDRIEEEAVACCYGLATHYRPTKSGQNARTFVGSYDFRLTRDAGRWRIAAFRFNLKYVDGNRGLESAE